MTAAHNTVGKGITKAWAAPRWLLRKWQKSFACHWLLNFKKDCMYYVVGSAGRYEWQIINVHLKSLERSAPVNWTHAHVVCTLHIVPREFGTVTRYRL